MQSHGISSQVQKPRRTTVFREVLREDQTSQATGLSNCHETKHTFTSGADISGKLDSSNTPFTDVVEDDGRDIEEEDGDTFTPPETEAQILSRSTPSTLYRLGMLTLLLVLAVPLFHNHIVLGEKGHAMFGAMGGVINRESESSEVKEVSTVARRQDSTDYCKRWSQQAAVVN
ncbi:hypothetical protein LTS18_002158, partial [Coniosporium uncinatum]